MPERRQSPTDARLRGRSTPWTTPYEPPDPTVTPGSLALAIELGLLLASLPPDPKRPRGGSVLGGTGWSRPPS